MVNKDQLEQTDEGRQVLALMKKHFPAEQFQPALTLIEQRYTEDLTVWDAGLNHDSKLPFERTSSAQRLLFFFTHPDHLTEIKEAIGQRPIETRPSAAPARKAGKKNIAAARKPRARKKKVAKAAKKKPMRAKRGSPAKKTKSLRAKARKSTRKRAPKRPAKRRSGPVRKPAKSSKRK